MTTDPRLFSLKTIWPSLPKKKIKRKKSSDPSLPGDKEWLVLNYNAFFVLYFWYLSSTLVFFGWYNPLRVYTSCIFLPMVELNNFCSCWYLKFILIILDGFFWLMVQEGTVFLEGLLSVRVIDVWTSWTQELCASLVCEMWLVSFLLLNPGISRRLWLVRFNRS